MQHLRIGSIVTVHFMSGPSSGISASGVTVTNVTDSYLEVGAGTAFTTPVAFPWGNIFYVEVTQD